MYCSYSLINHLDIFEKAKNNGMLLNGSAAINL